MNLNDLLWSYIHYDPSMMSQKKAYLVWIQGNCALWWFSRKHPWMVSFYNYFCYFSRKHPWVLPSETSLTVHCEHSKSFYYQILSVFWRSFSQIKIPVHYGIHYRVGTGKNVQKLFNSHINEWKGTFVSHEPWKR